MDMKEATDNNLNKEFQASVDKAVSSLQATDDVAAKVAVAPRVTLKDIENNIGCKFFLNGDDILSQASQTAKWASNFEVPVAIESLAVLTICVIVLRNGFTIIGKSAPASRENFNENVGQQFAYEDAIKQIWPLMGFALRDQLSKSN